MIVSELARVSAGRFDADPQIVHHFASGLYTKQMAIPAGFRALSHKHEHSHLSILASGKAKVSTDQSIAYYAAPACIEIAAGLNHEIEALTDVVWFCIHATEETDPATVDQVLIGA